MSAFDDLAEKWKLRLDIAGERNEPVYVTQAELAEIMDMEELRKQDLPPAVVAAERAKRMIDGRIGDFMAKPLVVDDEKAQIQRAAAMG